MFDKSVDVAGKTVLITGGAQGMGRLWAEHFAGDGARLVLWDLDEEGLEETGASFRARGWEVFTQVVDVTKRSNVYFAAGEVAEQFGTVDILVNNAGVVSAGQFLDMADKKLEATIDVDLKALLWTMKAFLPNMVKQGGGHILNVSSASGFIGVPFMPAYAAAKWGVLGLTDSLRLEMELLGHRGVRFTVFCPSYVDTGMFAGVKAPRLVPLLSPDEAVARGYRGFRKGEYVIKEPFVVKFTPALRALLPTQVFDQVSALMGVTTSMARWKGHGK